jgi:putative FmdB family regulatory protein
MPTYSFECRKCGHRFDLALSIGEYEKKEARGFSCPKCRCKDVEQLVVGCTVQTSKKS